MRKKYLNIIMCTSLLTLAGCSKEADIAIPDSAKQPIALAVGIESPMTRAVTLEKTNMEALPEGTDLWMVMKSEYVSLTDNALNFKGDQTAKYTVTSGVTGAADGAVNPITFGSGLTRYWDDAHARSSKLSVWSLAVPGKTGALSETAPWNAAAAWGTTAPSMTIDWTISNAQTSTTVGNEDLCFSNNIAKYTDSDGRMDYGSTENPYKFDQGKLIFYHALSKITIKLVEGDGFDHTVTTDFNFDSGNVAMKGFKLSGKFDVAQGEFTNLNTVSTTDITSIYSKEKTAEGYTLEALVMPNTVLNTSGPSDALSFSIDGNAYTVSSETIAASLRTALSQADGTDVTLEAGKNYILKFTINKTGIKLVATIGAWQDVVGTSYSPLINITHTYGHTGTEFANGFSFYMKEASTTDFAKGTDVTYNADAVAPARKYSLTTPLYWPNHSTHYNFRGIYPIVGDDGTPTDKVTATTVSVANAAYSSGTFPSDLMIGYPRKENDAAADETCKTHSQAGICATEGDIRLNFLYAMSQVEVILKSELETGIPETAKVALNGNTTVEILNGYTSGSIALMTGVATGTGDKAAWTMAGGDYNSETKQYDVNNAIVPQEIADLQFRIKVEGGVDGEGNQTYDYYYATISEIKVGGSTIPAWQPGKHYTYTLNITKTGIKITATLKDWETVTSDENHIWM